MIEGFMSHEAAYYLICGDNSPAYQESYAVWLLIDHTSPALIFQVCLM